METRNYENKGQNCKEKSRIYLFYLEAEMDFHIFWLIIYLNFT